MADGADLHGKIYGWLTDLGYTVDLRDTRRESLDVGGVSKRDSASTSSATPTSLIALSFLAAW